MKALIILKEWTFDMILDSLEFFGFCSYNLHTVTQFFMPKPWAIATLETVPALCYPPPSIFNCERQFQCPAEVMLDCFPAGTLYT